MKIATNDEIIELIGTEYAAVTFTLCTIEENTDTIEIDFSELDGMTRDEAIEYFQSCRQRLNRFGIWR